MTISVCVGSSCHIKGSRLILERLRRLVEERGLSGEIEINGVLCMDNCMHGVCVKLDGRFFSLTPEAVEKFFNEEVLPALDTGGA